MALFSASLAMVQLVNKQGDRDGAREVSSPALNWLLVLTK